MCTFCESVKDRSKKIIWQVRSTMADNNICEFVNDTTCSMCDACEMYFNIYGYEWSDNTYIGIGYNQKIMAKNKEEVIIRPFSETQQFNYCPFCGKQISKNIIDFDNIYNNHMEIEDEED